MVTGGACPGEHLFREGRALRGLVHFPGPDAGCATRHAGETLVPPKLDVWLMFANGSKD